MGIAAVAISDVARVFRGNLVAAVALDLNATRLAEEVGKPTVDWENVSKLAQNVGDDTSSIGELPGIKSNAIRTAVDSVHSLLQPARNIQAASTRLAYDEMRTARGWSVANPVDPVSVQRDVTSLVARTHENVRDLGIATAFALP